MASKDSLRIADSLAHMSKACSYIARVFEVVLVLYCIGILLFYGGALICYFAPDVLPFKAIPLDLPLLSSFLGVSIGAVTLFVLIEIAKDISKGSSPFTLIQSRRVKIIGILLLFVVVLRMIIPVDSVSLLESEELIYGFEPAPSDNYISVHLDIHSIMLAIICFFLSYVFKYGALLQRLSDDTV